MKRGFTGIEIVAIIAMLTLIGVGTYVYTTRDVNAPTGECETGDPNCEGVLVGGIIPEKVDETNPQETKQPERGTPEPVNEENYKELPDTSPPAPSEPSLSVLIVIKTSPDYEPLVLSEEERVRVLAEAHNKRYIIIQELEKFNTTNIKLFSSLPGFAATVTYEGLEYLEAHPDVKAVDEDVPVPVSIF
jgi:hypothetical protein